MGFRFRKSINLGGGFKVNLSKSGVGYSWGTKGARFTKTAKGTKRTTLSIPGTGISYSTETNGVKKAANSVNCWDNSTQQQSSNHFQNTSIRSNNQKGMNPTMKKMGNLIKKILLWILTTFFVIVGLAYLPTMTSFISLLVAVFLAPISKLQDLIGKFIKGKIKTIVIIILVIITFVSVPATETPDSGNPSETTASLADETKGTIQSTTNTEQTTAPTTEPTTAPTTEPTTAPTAEPITVPTTEPTTEPTTKPTTAPTTEPTETPTEDNGRDYVLNTNTMKFHYPRCSSADEIKDANKAYFHGTRDELIAKGYKPCGRCHP